MPWSARTFAKHNRHLHGAALHEAAARATALLKEGHSEGSAIRLANWLAKHRHKRSS